MDAPDIDLIDIGSPNNTHKEIALAAAKAGKMIACEKPLAMNVAEAEEMVQAVEEAGVANMVWFNYRRVPAVALAKQLVDEGRVGRPFHYRATYLQDWTISPDVPQGGAGLWRLDVNVAGSGVTGDLLAHSIDTAMWLNGPITRVVGEDRNVRHRAQARRDAAKSSLSASTMPACFSRSSRTDRWARSNRPAMPAAARTTTPSS